MATSAVADRSGVTTLRIRILGALQVEGLTDAALGSRKQRTLLRVLALAAGAPVGVDHLIDCLWGDRPPVRPRDQVGVLVSRLRSVLGAERVGRGDAGYRLIADWIDLTALDQLAAEAERRLAEGQPAAAATAAAAGRALARGPLLADEAGAEWAAEARLELDRTLARLRVIGAEAALRTGDAFGAAAAAQAALDQDPYDEHALRLLMTAHVRAGRPASALAAFARTSQVLADDLGTSPSEATAAMHLAILKEELPAALEESMPAPPDRPHLPGRDTEMRLLDEALARAAERVEVVVVEGEPGIGKTRLLDAWSDSIGASATVIRGRCDEIGALPLQPVLDGLDDLLGRLDEAAAGDLRRQAGPVLRPLLRGGDEPDPVADTLTARAALFTGALRACVASGPCVLVVDDVHLADATTLSWLSFIAGRATAAPLLLLLARRPERPLALPRATRIVLAPLDLAATAEVVGTDRAPALLQRTRGNPLFLVELADLEGEDLPASIVESVEARCARSGPSAATLRTAAVLGPGIDLDLLAGVLRRSAVDLLTDLEEGQRLMILEEHGAAFRFRHDLVREALMAGTGAARRALTHREAARLLAGRERHDPLAVAAHARLGGDLELAAGELVAAAMATSARFDHAAAESLLDESVGLRPAAASHLARGRVRLARENFLGAAADAEAARGLGAVGEALELASWSAYYRRDFAAARDLCRLAEEALAPSDGQLRASVAALRGRIAHADGHLETARASLEAATAISGTRGVAGVWLGWLLTDRGAVERADALAEQAGDGSLSSHPFGTAHRLLLAAHAAALRGRISAALDLLDAVDREVERRNLDHFAGRTANYRAWLLRNLLLEGEADQLNLAAAEISARRGLREPQAQSALDRADAHLRRGELDRAAATLERAAVLGTGHAFGWKAGMRHRLLKARLQLDRGRIEEALAAAEGVAAEAARLHLPRYATLARATAIRARALAGAPVGAAEAARVLADLERYAAPEAWWTTAEIARDADIDEGWAMAEERAARAAAGAGDRAPGFTDAASRWLERARATRPR